MKHSLPRFTVAAVLAAGLVVLGGCATSYVVDNNVQAFSSLAGIPAQPTYRFERLPSQQEPGQAQVEAMADAALNQAGLRRDDAAPRYTVQVSGRINRILSPWSDPRDAFFGAGFGWGRRGHMGMGLGLGYPADPPWFHREVSVVVRELGTAKVVFESHATHDGPWVDNTAVFPAMFAAAMQGFPQPPVGPRRVDVAVPS